MVNYFSTKSFIAIICAIFFTFYIVGVFWSFEPDEINIREQVVADAKADGVTPVVGYTTTTALIRVAETLLDKPGGYLHNDAMPPSLFLDNIPSWEFGALEMIRDLTLVMRQDFSRSQSQSLENPHLKSAQPRFNIDAKSWVMPSAESEYKKAIKSLYAYRSELADVNAQNAPFYAVG